MGRWIELGGPLTIIALLAWATWPSRGYLMLGWYLLLALGAVAVVLSVVLPPDWRARPAPVLAGIALVIAALILAYAALRPIPWKEWGSQESAEGLETRADAAPGSRPADPTTRPVR
jgi:membrane protease YdiL (CAAX protease family)